MFDYLYGKVVKTESSYVVLDVNNIGFKVYTPNPYVFVEEERELFLKLINVKGLGPKLALPILATGSVEGIKDAINRENIMYLKKFPKIGEKVARQIILDLKGKIVSSDNYVDSESELYQVLLSLGYKSADINAVIKQVNKENTIELQVKEALKLLLR